MWCVVPAAGIGSRFGSDLPKQYTDIFPDVTILEHSLNQLLQFPKFHGIMVALHPDDKYWNKLAIAQNPKIHKCLGGNERSQSVINALRSIRDRFKISDDKWVMVHDAARPAISLDLICELYEKVMSSNLDGGILTTRLVDTIKHSNGNNLISHTVDRDNLWAAQTPQMFKHNQLLSALESATVNNLSITDEASAIEQCGGKVLLVESESSNFKITTKFDLKFMQAILKNNLS